MYQYRVISRRVCLRALANGTALVGATAVLNACGLSPSTTTNPGTIPTSAIAEPTTIVSANQTINFLYYDPMIKPLIDAFQVANPTIRVNMTTGDGVEQSLLRQLDTADVPDVSAITSSWVGIFAKQGGLADLAGAPYDGANMRSEIMPAAWSEGLGSDGKLIGMPYSTTPGSFWYRKDILDAAGVESDSDVLAEQIKTWDDLFGFAQEVKRKQPKTSLLFHPEIDVFGPMVAQQGNNLIDGNKVLIVQKCTLPAQKAAEVRALKLDADLGSGLFSNVALEATLAGSLAGVAGLTWFQTSFRERFPKSVGLWRVLPPPGGPYIRYTQYLVIPERSQKKELAWQFVRFCSASLEGQTTLLRAISEFPTYMPVWNEVFFNQGVPFFGNQPVYRIWGEVARTSPTGKGSPYDHAIEDLLIPAIRDVIEAGIPAEKAMQDVQDRVIKANPGLTS